MKLEDPKQTLESSLESNFGINAMPKWKAESFLILYNIIPRTATEDSYAITLLIGSFLQLISIIIIVTEATDPVLVYMKYFRLFPIVQYMESALINIVAMFVISLILLVYFAFLMLSTVFHKGFGLGYTTILQPVLYWLGIIPITQMYISFLRCESGMSRFLHEFECFSTVYWIEFTLVIFMLLIWLDIIVVITIVSTYSNSFGNNHFAHYPWNFEILYVIIRMAYVLISDILVHTGSFSIYFRWIMFVVTSVYFLSQLIDVFPYYNPVISYLFAGSIFTFILNSFCGLVIHLIEVYFELNTSTRLIFFIIITVFSFTLAKILHRNQTINLLASTKLESPKKLDMQIYLFLTRFVSKKHFMKMPDTFSNGYLQYYKKWCKDRDCPLFATTKLEVERVFYDDSCEDEKKLADKNGRLRHFAIYLLESQTQKEKLCLDLNLQLARMYAYILGNMHLACAKILATEDMNPGITAQFSIFCFKQDIIKFFERKNLSQQKKGRGSFYDVLIYEKLFGEFVNVLEETTKLRIKFWTELEHNPDLNELHTLGAEITTISQKINAIWNQLTEIYPLHHSSLVLYLNYLNLVTGYYDEAAKVEQVLNKLQWQGGSRELSNAAVFSNNSTSIIMGGSRHNVGKILSASITMEKLFGYASKMLINKNVTILMPAIIRKRHNELMQSYFQSGCDYSKGLSFPTFALHKNGFIIPVKVAKQQIYSLKLGLIYVGNIALDEEVSSNDFVLTNEEGLIAGITQRLSELLKIKPNTLLEQHLFIQEFCSELNNAPFSTLQGTVAITFSPGFKKSGTMVATRRNSKINLGKKRQSIPIQEYESVPALRSVTKGEITTYSYPQINFNFKVLKLPPIKINKRISSSRNNKFTDALLYEIMPSIAVILKRSLMKLSSKEPQALQLRKESHDQHKVDAEEVKLSSQRNEGEIINSIGTNQLTTDMNKNQTTEKFLGAETKNIIVKEKTKSSSKLVKSFKSSKVLVKDSETALISLNLNIVSSEKVKKASAAHLTMANIRDQSYSDFYPVYIKRLKYLIYLFMFAVFCCIIGCLLMYVFLNMQFHDFGDIIIWNSRRFSALGNVAKMTTMMIFYTTYGAASGMEERDSYFDYGLLLNNSDKTGYKNYLLQQAKYSLDEIIESQKKLSRYLEQFSPSHAEFVNSNSVKYKYITRTQEIVSYNCSMECAMLIVFDFTKKVIGKIENNEMLNLSSFEEYVVAQGSYGDNLMIIKSAFLGISLEYKKLISYHNKISIGFLVTIIAVLVAILVMLFIFMIRVKRKVSFMLLLFVEISEKKVEGLIKKHSKFLKEILNKDNEPNDYEELNLDDVNVTLKGNENEASPTTAKTKAIYGKNKKYIPYENNNWKVFLVAVFVVTIIILVDVIYSVIEFKTYNLFAHKAEELQRIMVNNYFNSYILALLYFFISSNKKAMCGNITCSSVILYGTADEDRNLNLMLTQHKKYNSHMSSRYSYYFKNIVEGNPCESIEEFKQNEFCKTLLGGIFMSGAYAASKNILELCLGIYMDFLRTEDRPDNVKTYMNDKRLIDIEIFNGLFLNPAYSLLAKELVMDMDHVIHSNTNRGTIVFTTFCIFIVIVTIVGGRWLTQYFRKSMYNTRAMLINLPPDVIISCKEIVKYLVRKPSSR